MTWSLNFSPGAPRSSPPTRKVLHSLPRFSCRLAPSCLYSVVIHHFPWRTLWNEWPPLVRTANALHCHVGACAVRNLALAPKLSSAHQPSVHLRALRNFCISSHVHQRRCAHPAEKLPSL